MATKVKESVATVAVAPADDVGAARWRTLEVVARHDALELAIRMHGDVLMIHAGNPTTADDVLATADKIAKWLAGGDK